jgi:hypothetical protein
MVLYEGSPQSKEPFVKPFRALQPVISQDHTSTYLGLAKLFGVDEDGPGCANGVKTHSFPISLKQYNITAVRAAYNTFNEYTGQHADLAGSFIVFENYPMQGLIAMPDKSNAVAHRQFDILV